MDTRNPPVMDGDFIRRLRKRMGKSMEEVAAHVGCSIAHMSRIEKNVSVKYSHLLVTRIADFYGVTIAEITMGNSNGEEEESKRIVDIIREIQIADILVIEGQEIVADSYFKKQLELAILKEVNWIVSQKRRSNLNEGR